MLVYQRSAIVELPKKTLLSSAKAGSALKRMGASLRQVHARPIVAKAGHVDLPPIRADAASCAATADAPRYEVANTQAFRFHLKFRQFRQYYFPFAWHESVLAQAGVI